MCRRFISPPVSLPKIAYYGYSLTARRYVTQNKSHKQRDELAAVCRASRQTAASPISTTLETVGRVPRPDSLPLVVVASLSPSKLSLAERGGAQATRVLSGGKTPEPTGSIPPVPTCVSAVERPCRYKPQRCNLCAVTFAVPKATGLCNQRSA